MPANPLRTLSFAAKGGIVVFVNHEQTPSEPEWAAYQDAIQSEGALHGHVRILVVTEGGTPSPRQRQQAAELAAKIRCRSAVVTDSVIARTVVTVFSWLGVEIQAFSSGRLQDALNYLEASSPEREWCLATVVRLKAQLGNP